MSEQPASTWYVEKVVTELAEVAWAAGVIDARGSLRAIPRKAPGTYTPMISVRALGNVREDHMVGRLEICLGGSVTRPKGGTWRWQLQGSANCLEAIDKLAPFMSAKAVHVIALRRLCAAIVEYRRESFDRRELPLEEVRQREEFAGVLGIAVRRGVAG